MMIKKLLIGTLLISAALAAFKAHSRSSSSTLQGDTILYLTKSRCPYCVHTSPIIKQMKAKFGNRIKFVTLSNQEAEYSHYEFQTYPMVLYFRDGQEVHRHGSMDKRLTAQMMEKNIRNIYQV